ncbi:MAG: glycosyl hydrolase, partial [Gemmatimonadetes bacterium]|nr:glycosyl hydrolase [Gemmatimonadota bacterium]NIU77717.1 glycosyl hydrolase [Gammaproteobacteria bacterium]NIV57589.1 glycosyl hydrolase [Actinomycetota bacterium]NIQ57555.1 glycosyl hydrolase [Gemmatimonadota bacterium]NIX46872.1 glycosyl hydrolase [Gemmatimonadota bacterium]
VSPHAPGRAYVAVQRYRMDDFRPYVFATQDHGRSWRLLTDGQNGIPANHPVRTVREDPARAGLLYAGTEFGMYVSFDDGRHWQSLQLDLPVTPVTGMRVHDGDLVVATQGRSFWILDDLTPLHQLGPEVARADAHLFRPRDVYRVNAAGSSEEFSPQPLPQGALIHYYLAAAPAAPVTLEILDARGRLVRSFTSDSAKAEQADGKTIPAEAGMHRVVWDLTYPGPDVPDSVVIWGYTGGVKAPPGEYRARLVADGREQAQEFRVLADPRLTNVAQEDFEEQYRLGAEIRDTIDRVYGALRDIRSVEDQVRSIAARLEGTDFDPALRTAADSLVAKLAAVEVEITQTRSRSGQDPIRFPARLDNQYLELYRYVTGPDAYISGGPERRPTRAAYTRLTDLNTQWTGLGERIRRILDAEVAAFNAALERAGVPG